MGPADGLTMINVTRRWAKGSKLLALLSLTILPASAQQTTLALDPAHTSVKFTLGDVLHTVHGSFQLKRGALQFEPSSGTLSGEIVVDAKSGESGSGMRDRKMHKEVLESETYPEISFRPDRVEGAVASPGKSSVKVHGMFRIHGVDREILVPAEVEMSADHWTAAIHFTVPYAKWGMKNPSTLFLRVDDSVEIDLTVAGSVAQHGAAVRDSAR
jgi:polyisoprenoid-binding protein YceI